MQKFISFSSDISNIPLPEKFDYPYNYEPHSLAKIAVTELQNYLQNQTDFKHDFGINNSNKNAVGKMFGVLVVKNQLNQLGYLTAFSGKLADKTQHKHFVPPIFDVLDENEFYLKTEKEIDTLNHQIKTLENNKDFKKISDSLKKELEKNNFLLKKEKEKIKTKRKLRKINDAIDNQLNINEEFYLREYEVYLDDKLAISKKTFENHQTKIESLKQKRKEKSAWIQQEIFKKYTFLNALHKRENLLTIFNEATQNIPAGSGDCCAPKLLQYAFLNNFSPICMAEFWWGKPLQKSVRKHNYFYPACTGKCKPILTHMLQGLKVNENPLTSTLKKSKELEIIFEDEVLLVINKPHELLSVSGKEIENSVYSIIKKKYPEATGPLLVHRLDMSTSGILLIAKTKEAHKIVQSQFINKTVQKRYVAILDGILPNNKGTINLPLRVDLNDRPKQLVCYEYGKNATTIWKTITVKNNRTKVYLYPITGRTHQLRVHAAHHCGLNVPILGDDLYGKKEKRLYLHAEFIKFVHPINSTEMSFTINAPF